MRLMRWLADALEGHPFIAANVPLAAFVLAVFAWFYLGPWVVALGELLLALFGLG